MKNKKKMLEDFLRHARKECDRVGDQFVRQEWVKEWENLDEESKIFYTSSQAWGDLE